MCDPVSILASGVMSAVTQRGAGKVAQAEAYASAAEEESNARAEAAVLRRQGERQRGAALAAIAASGVKIGEGSTLDAERQVMEDAYRDEYMVMLTGDRRARAMRRQGDDARRAGRINAVNSLLQAGAGAARAGGWRAYGPGFSGGQRPAPIEDRSVRLPTSRSGRGWMDY